MIHLAGAVSNHVKGSINFMGNLVMLDNEANVSVVRAMLGAILGAILRHGEGNACRLGMVFGVRLQRTSVDSLLGVASRQ